MLYQHQERLLKKNPKKCLLAWETGTGKTKIAIELAKKNGKNCLVIVPKGLLDQWKRIVLNEHPNSNSTKAFIYTIITKEQFKKDIDNIDNYDVVVCDEAHYISNQKSQLSKAFQTYIKKYKTEYIYLLTATPYLSTPWNIYALAMHLGYKMDYWKFKQKFFYDVVMGRRIVPIVKKGMEDEIAKIVAHIGDIVRLDECVDVPQQVFEVEHFKMTEAQTKAKAKVIEAYPIVKFTKYHQIENGFLNGDGYEPDQKFENDKIDRIKEYCSQNKKIAIVCHYNLQLYGTEALLRLEFPERKILIVNGETKNRDEVIQAAEKADDCIIIINASCSEGYELPSFGIILFASLSFSYKNYKQIIGRFLRINKLKKNVYIHLVAEGVDEAVYKSILAKQDFDIAIYNQ